MLLFLNSLMKLKCPNLLNPLATMILKTYWSFYPLRAIYFHTLQYETPCVIECPLTHTNEIFDCCGGSDI